ncbi:MAG: ATP-binding protein [Leptospiraceae bacterium]|nr:ATP-binding protein [Leptospiraceae bacterium]
MQPLPIGIQTFRDLREGNFLYIDKTKQIYPLIEHSKGAYFLARPRRFGKSLMLSVLEEIFSANKELFEGLWIYNSNWKWKKYPVLRFDFSKQKAKTIEELKHFIFRELNLNAEKYNIKLNAIEYFAQFEELIQKTAQAEKVVILIDEYDKPIIDNLTETELAKEMREVMKGFFTVLKGCDPHIRFLLLTGVSKFSKAGVFSNLNHLRDISLEDEFCDLLGITEEELENYFKEYIVTLGEKEKLSYEETLDKIREWYNGYQFSPEGVKVYNPFSTLLLLAQKRFEYHWFETGTPEFLVNLILKNNYNISEIPMKTTILKFSTYEVEDLSITPLLFQTGYLTIKDYDAKERLYTLDFPNLEVKDAFLNYIYGKIQKEEETRPRIYELAQAIREDDIEQAMFILKEIFLSIDYDLHLKSEKYYQTVFYLVFHLLGLRIRTEVKTNIGRIDAVVEGKSVYIFEFKLNSSKEEALEQIKKNKYYEKSISKGKPVYLVGVEFKDRNIGEYLVERVE